MSGTGKFKICKYATLILLMLLASSSRIHAYQYQNISQFSDCVSNTPIAACSAFKMDMPVLHQSSSQLALVKQDSNLINLNKKNYQKKIILFHQIQGNKNKNVVYNLSSKPTLGEIISNKKFFLESPKSKKTFLFKKIISDTFLLHLANVTFSQQILSSFYLLFYKKNISFVKTFIFFIKQEKLFSNNYYQNFCDRPEKKKPKSIIIHGSIFALNYKVGNKVFLSCDLKNDNLSCGDQGFITRVTKNSNKISVSFVLGQPLKSLQFREKLNSIVSIFVLEI